MYDTRSVTVVQTTMPKRGKGGLRKRRKVSAIDTGGGVRSGDRIGVGTLDD